MGQPYGKSFKVGEFNFIDELQVDVEVNVESYDSGYNPYPTSNHDDPRYSDPGSGSEAEYKVYLSKIDKDDKKIYLDITDFLTDENFKYLDEQIDEYALEIRNDSYQSAMEDRYEDERWEK